MNTSVLQVVNWDKHFENNRSRAVEKCTWVAMPNTHDGDGYKRIILRKDGLQIFAAWCLLLQVLSKQPNPRVGLLTHDGTLFGRIFTEDDFHIKTLVPQRVFQKLIEVTTSIEIGWIRKLEICQKTDENGQKIAVFDETGVEINVSELTPDCHPHDVQNVSQLTPDCLRARVLKEGRKERQSAAASRRHQTDVQDSTLEDFSSPGAGRRARAVAEQQALALQLAGSTGIPVAFAVAVVADWITKLDSTADAWEKLGDAGASVRRHFSFCKDDVRFAHFGGEEHAAPPSPRVFACTICSRPERECVCEKPGPAASLEEVRAFRARYRTMALHFDQSAPAESCPLPIAT